MERVYLLGLAHDRNGSVGMLLLKKRALSSGDGSCFDGRVTLQLVISRGLMVHVLRGTI